MKRRELLRRAGALASVAGLAGCLGSGPPGGGANDSGDSTANEPDGTTSDDSEDCEPTETTADDFSGIESDADEPFRTVSVGDRDEAAFPDNNRPRTVRIWNAADESRDIDVRVNRGSETPFDETVEFAADAYLSVTLEAPADYGVSVGVSDAVTERSCDANEGADTGASTGASAESAAFEVARSAFDCNTATIDAGVMPDGSVETVETATTMGCGGPRLAATEFDAEQGDCGTQNTASVTFEAESVRIEGTVRTPTPAWTVELADTDYDEDADTLSVRVRARESGSTDASVQCVATIPYEATANFENALPGEVVVTHDTDDGATEVASETRADD
ncbi:hypothetical protein [Halorussus amylolyticus]|uniref:hypothetical protein n=1 Tax=Halorussus amylolyticus TaxID=1126242 RepID=UPI00104A2260|nr:hypothetical protein [Halorussus amylolyticus]